MSRELEKAALDNAYQAEIGRLFSVLLSNLVVKEKDAIGLFKRGLDVCRKSYREAVKASEEEKNV